jgi:hypothetical protein
VRLCAMSMNDEVIIKASSALAMLMQVQGDIVDPATGRPRRHAVVNALKIHGTGGVSALLAQLRRSRNERVLLESAKALKQLIRMRESQRGADGDDEWGDREVSASCGDVFPVILSIFTRSQSVFVHAEAAEATYLLALSQECAPALAAAGAVETLAAHCESCRQAPVPSLSRPRYATRPRTVPMRARAGAGGSLIIERTPALLIVTVERISLAHEGAGLDRLGAVRAARGAGQPRALRGHHRS